MNNQIKQELYNRGVDIVRFVDISAFPEEQMNGFNKAVLFCMALSKNLF